MVAEPFRSRWGTPLVVRVAIADDSRWVGSFEAGGMRALTGVFACPNPIQALVVCDGRPYLVDVTAPTRATVVDLEPVTQVRRVRDLDLLVLAGHSDLAALGPTGLVWHSERLCLDDLRVLDAAAEGIRCAGDLLGSSEEFTVDALTGQVRSGPRFLDIWPGD
ncbi:MAG TPA: hypothetical protein VGC06_29775 [Actinomycetes bacterium]